MPSIHRNSKQQLQAPHVALKSTAAHSLVASAHHSDVVQQAEINTLEMQMMVSIKSSLSIPRDPAGRGAKFMFGSANNINAYALPDHRERVVDVPLFTPYSKQIDSRPTRPYKEGTWVAFSIDIMELASREPPNSFLRANLGYYPVGKYVGYVAGSFARTDTKGRHVEYISVLLLAPAQHRIEDVVARMSVPVDCGGDPARPPLTTNLPFPWPGCRQLTGAGMHLEVTQAHYEGLTVCSTGESHRQFRVSCENDFTFRTSDRQCGGGDVWLKWTAKDHAIPAQIWKDILIAGPVGHQPPDPTLLLTEIEDITKMLRTQV